MSEATPSAGAVVVDSFVVCAGLEALVDSCSPCVVCAMDGLETAVKLPLANLEECTVGLGEVMVVVDGVESIDVAVEKMSSTLVLAVLRGNLEEPLVVDVTLLVLVLVV